MLTSTILVLAAPVLVHGAISASAPESYGPPLATATIESSADLTTTYTSDVTITSHVPTTETITLTRSSTGTVATSEEVSSPTTAMGTMSMPESATMVSTSSAPGSTSSENSPFSESALTSSVSSAGSASAPVTVTIYSCTGEIDSVAPLSTTSSQRQLFTTITLTRNASSTTTGAPTVTLTGSSTVLVTSTETDCETTTDSAIATGTQTVIPLPAGSTAVSSNDAMSGMSMPMSGMTMGPMTPVTTASGIYYSPSGTGAPSGYGTGIPGSNTTVVFPTLSTSANSAVSATATGGSIKTAISRGGLILTALVTLYALV